MFDYTSSLFSGIFGYEDWSWYFRIIALFAIPFILMPLILIDIIKLIASYL